MKEEPDNLPLKASSVNTTTCVYVCPLCIRLIFTKEKRYPIKTNLTLNDSKQINEMELPMIQGLQKCLLKRKKIRLKRMTM